MRLDGHDLRFATSRTQALACIGGRVGFGGIVAEGRVFAESWTPLVFLDCTFRLIREHLHRVTVAVVAMSALGVASDLDPDRAEFALLASVVTLAMQYWLTAGLLDDLGLRLAGKPRFLAFFLTSALTWLGIFAGLVLGLVPGLILLAGWWVATVALIAGEGNVVGSIAYSWRVTRGLRGDILGTGIAMLAPFVVGLGLLYLILLQVPAEQEAFALVVVGLLELVLSFGFVVAWHSAIAVYVLTRRETFASEIFA